MEILLLLIGLIFVSRIQPIFIIRSIIIITILYSYIIYIIIEIYWFGYVLVIVILSGVLVIFTYIVRLSPNERFENYNLVILLLVIFILIFRRYIYYDNMSYISLFLWVSYVGLYNIYIVGFLLGVILMVVWIVGVKLGAVRVIYLCAWLKG